MSQSPNLFCCILHMLVLFPLQPIKQQPGIDSSLCTLGLRYVAFNTLKASDHLCMCFYNHVTAVKRESCDDCSLIHVPPWLQVFLFMANGKGHSWAYATPGFEVATATQDGVLAQLRTLAGVPETGGRSGKAAYTEVRASTVAGPASYDLIIQHDMQMPAACLCSTLPRHQDDSRGH